MGVAEAILALPGESKFTGNTGLVALIFRRLLEDETTLQAAMEAEMRSAISKLISKNGSPSRSDSSSVTLHAFIGAVTPLLCRDPVSFLKALALSVRVEPKSKNSSDTKVSLLSIDDRSKHLSALSEVLRIDGTE